MTNASSNTQKNSLTKNRLSRIISEGGWIAVGQVASILGSFAMVRVLTENLDTSEYGQLALVLTVTTLVNQVVMGGIISGLGRFYSIALAKGDLLGYIHAAQRLFKLCTIVVFAFGIVVLSFLFVADLYNWFWLATITLVLSILVSFNGAFNSIQNAARQRAIVALHGGMDAWLKIASALGVIACFGANSTAVVTGYTLSAAIVMFSQFFFLRRLLVKKTNKYLNNSKNDWESQIWFFSWPMMVGGVFNWGYYASQRWALELFTSTEDVGKFFAFTQVAYTPITLAGSFFMSLIAPIVYARVGNPENKEHIHNLWILISKIALAGFICTLIAAFIAHFKHDIIFRILVAEKYRAYSASMPFIVMAAGLLQTSQILSLFVTSKNQTKSILPLAVYGQSIIIVLNFIGTYSFGINGLIATMFCGALLHLLWMIFIIRKAM